MPTSRNDPTRHPLRAFLPFGMASILAHSAASSHGRSSYPTDPHGRLEPDSTSHELDYEALEYLP
ncbi:UNVERIFIED_CONTAM: hypothetical protein Sradi_1612800 [Sesamum radiatum]|uniref:Uncharacterized protein n=1 Tax=Sesamum radiatum TaxID=300843 RepID=A0AAW2U9U2_SESRA